MRANAQKTVWATGGSWREMLNACPAPNLAARTEKGPAGDLLLRIPAARPRFLVLPLSWIVPFRPEHQLVLDRLGAEIWGLCDARHTVEQIVDEFATRHRLSFHEGRVAVTGYLKSLIQRGALAIVMAEPSPSGHENDHHR